MALGDIFKKKKPKIGKKTEEKTENGGKPEKEIFPKTQKKEGKFFDAWRVLKSPHISEKATELGGKNQYIFKIWPRTNKVEIKKAIESLYGVDVISVKVINIPSKRRRVGRTSGWRKGYKKAIVKIKEGQKIELLPR